MNQVPLPSRHEVHFEIIYMVQWFPELAYDHLGFTGFPERKGFSTQTLRRRNGPEHYIERMAVFQSWCFVGIMIDFFAALDIHIGIDDLTVTPADGVTLLDASCLPILSSRIANMNQTMDFEDIVEFHCKIKRVLAHAGIAVRRFSDAIDDPTWSTVRLSAIMMGEYLTSMMRNYSLVEDPTPSPWFGRSVLGPQLMNEAGWCPSLSKSSIDQGMKQSSMYYLSRMSKSMIQKDHSTCNADRCVVDNVDEKTYQVKHADSCQDSSGCSIIALQPPAWTLFLDLVKKRQVPLITVAKSVSTEGINIEVTACTFI